MEDRETLEIHKYGETKMARIMIATVRHVTAWEGRTKYQAAWFLLNRVYMRGRKGSRHISFQGYYILYQIEVETDTTSVNLIIQQPG
jgi:hypothetical protein